MAIAASRRVIAALTALSLAAMSGGAGARMPGTLTTGTPLVKLPYSPIPGSVRPAGLWDKPNEACMTKCQIHVQKGCFKRLSKKNPAAGAAALQEMCDGKFSLCLYDCMCDTCDENQIIIKQ